MMDKAFLEITNRCNLSCSFCHGTVRPPRVMTAEEYEALTDRLTGCVTYLYFHLMGEPLVHPLLPQFIRRAWEKGFRPMLTTNGTLLAARGEELLSALPYKVSISMHAPEANGAFADAAYLAGCVSFAARAAEKGCITVLRLWNLGGEAEGNAAILDALRRAFPREWCEIRSGFRLAPRVFLEWGERFEWPDLARSPRDAATPAFCYGLRDQIGILCDGRVVPCCLDAEGALTLGNLYETPLDEILASPRAHAIYNGFTAHRATEVFCRTCDFAYRFRAEL